MYLRYTDVVIHWPVLTRTDMRPCQDAEKEAFSLDIELTNQSAFEYDRIRFGRMTPSMAAEYLREGRIVLRTFIDTLRDMYPVPDLQDRLIACFQTDGDPRSAGKKVRNWLKGQNRPASREDIFRIAFALDLSEGQVNHLLGLCTEYGIHYRDGRDVVYAWFLRTGRTYEEARDFFASLPEPARPGEAPPEAGSQLTHEIQAAFQRVQSLEELRTCYTANLDRFGWLHLRAYNYFRKYLDHLLHPVSSWDGEAEADYSMEAVMDHYFSLRMPSGRDRSGYTAVQKLLKHNWPNTTALKNIRNRKDDVPRKLLLLLYVVTENVVDDSYHELDEEYITMQERLEDHWWTLNAILTDCGMPTLDPRNPTDWLVLYALTADDESMSERMEQVIEKIYD